MQRDAASCTRIGVAEAAGKVEDAGKMNALGRMRDEQILRDASEFWNLFGIGCG